VGPAVPPLVYPDRLAEEQLGHPLGILPGFGADGRDIDRAQNVHSL
jgi:hypothetical protein